MPRDDDTEIGPPLTELAASTVQTHELYVSFIRAGFTMDEALKLVIGLLRPNAPAA